MIVPKITPPGEFLLINYWSGKDRETLTHPVHLRLYSAIPDSGYDSPALTVDTVFTIENNFRDRTLF